ncbi:Ankyrin repeat domain-containing protein [Tetrabaena socialis]|uniref:Ankyrin repeat domain-containing protein n=1 Tax=Tetrabaena socialis TaxID=47790 RepID=A0A2J8AAK2_9CHLO|nr:Ankyrin repeat domain-containing protein [Tetrabaena socialis]|eukprot:PNH09548.1 Ankyrin repeat domain-containing protein [Tetrabaena socialis]
MPFFLVADAGLADAVTPYTIMQRAEYGGEVIRRVQAVTELPHGGGAENNIAFLKDVTCRLANDLSTFQLAMGVEQRSELMRTIHSLRADLTNIRFEIMRGLESLAAKMREDMERLWEEARAAPTSSRADEALLQQRIQAAVVAGLHKAGVLKSAAGASREEAEEIATALTLELEGLRRDKRVLDEQYLEQMVAALVLQDVRVSSGSSSGSRWPTAVAVVAASYASPPHDYCCPITLCVMRDPVTVESGHTFERKAIVQHLTTSNTNPLTSTPLQTKAVTPNINLRNAIESWLIVHGMTHEQADAAGMRTGNAQRSSGGSSGSRWPTAVAAASPPHDFLCPITLCVMRDPVTVESGHTFEWQAIMCHLAISNTNPITSTPLQTKAVTPNINLRNTIESWLIEHGMTYEQADARALLTAAKEGRLREVQTLLSDPANVNSNVQDENGWTALHCASEKGHKEMVEVLLRAGADVAAKSTNGWTALHLASQKGHTEAVKVLLRAGADVAVKSNNGWTALHLASQKGHTEPVEALLRSEANVAAKSDNGTTALHWASEKGHTGVVEALLRAGADVAAKSKDGRTAMHLASLNGHTEAVKALLRAGADMAAKSNDGWTTLHGASQKGHTEVVEALLRAGADVTTKSTNGTTALHWASDKGHTEVVELLLRVGADVAAKSKSGVTPQQMVAREFAEIYQPVNVAAVNMIQDTATLEPLATEYNKNGTTALHWASDKGHTEVVELLLRVGADVAAKSKEEEEEGEEGVDGSSGQEGERRGRRVPAARELPANVEVTVTGCEVEDGRKKLTTMTGVFNLQRYQEQQCTGRRGACLASKSSKSMTPLTAPHPAITRPTRYQVDPISLVHHTDADATVKELGICTATKDDPISHVCPTDADATVKELGICTATKQTKAHDIS